MSVNKILVNNNDSNYTHSIFDISEYTGNSYSTLTDALNAIPQAKQKGGMTIRYIDSNDKYVQYRLMSTSWSITESDWQGVDAAPVAGSFNLALSDGIARLLNISQLRNGSKGNLANIKEVCTSVIELSDDKICFIENKRLNTSGYHYEYSAVLTDSSSDIGKLVVSANLVGNLRTLDWQESNIFDLSSSSYSQFVGIMIGIREVDSSSNENTLRKGDFVEKPIVVRGYNDVEKDIINNVNLLNVNKTLSEKKNKLQIYPGSTSKLEIEESNTSRGSVYIHNMAWQVRGSYSKTYASNSVVATEAGITLVTSPSGATNCIEILNTYVLAFDISSRVFKLKTRDTVSIEDIPLFSCVNGKVIETNKIGDSYIFPSLSLINQNIKELSDKVDGIKSNVEIGSFVTNKMKSYLQLFQAATGKIESFMFFSDPHYYNSYNENVLIGNASKYLGTMKQYFDNLSLNFVLCGGDWLTAHNQLTAIEDLGEIDGYMNKCFNLLYYPTRGNHDNNCQGEMTGDTNTNVNDGAISDQQMINLWFRKYGKMYYSFKVSETKFYIFDSGTTAESKTNRWEQVDWFANELLENDDEHIVMEMHIVELDYQAGASEFGNDVCTSANNFLLVAEAFNARTSITLNGNTYDFSNKTGKVHCALCGHTHYDATAVIHNIPVYCIKNATNGDFDLILLDYAANKLKSVRVGTGSDRQMDLV